MFDLDQWQEIWHALSKNKVRTLLTAFGVFWGIFMLMLMLGSGTGLSNGVQRDFADQATNSFFVWTQRTTKPHAGLPAGRSFQFTNADVPAIRQGVPEAAVIAPRNQLGGYRGGNNVTRGTRAGAFSVMGDYPEYHQIEAVRIARGRYLNHLDLVEHRKIAVIGSRVVDLLFESGEEPIGDSIRINGVYFKVVGVFKTAKTGDDGDQDASTIYIPFTTFQRAFNYGDTVGWFAITSVAGVPASVTEERVIDLLKARHQVAPDDDRAIGHWNTEKEYLQMAGLFRGINALVWIVGIGTLAAGVIGVSNIMLIIVKERTRELGVRRAVGATPTAIVGHIVLEAIILTAIAGYIGLVTGVAVMEAVQYGMQQAGAQPQMFLNPAVSLSDAVTALVILVVAGVLAGVIPAQRAVRISPVEALRSE